MASPNPYQDTKNKLNLRDVLKQSSISPLKSTRLTVPLMETSF
jgi:hypothetical protein